MYTHAVLLLFRTSSLQPNTNQPPTVVPSAVALSFTGSLVNVVLSQSRGLKLTTCTRSHFSFFFLFLSFITFLPLLLRSLFSSKIYVSDGSVGVKLHVFLDIRQTRYGSTISVLMAWKRVDWRWTLVTLRMPLCTAALHMTSI